MKPQENAVDILYVEDDVVDVQGAKRLFKKLKNPALLKLLLMDRKH